MRSILVSYVLSLVGGQLIVNQKALHETSNVGDFFSTATKSSITETKILSDGKLCDPNVQQHSGYIKFVGNEGGDKSLFFWMFESRDDPVNDPFVIWLTGGPGCSSMLALLSENGPCTVDGAGQNTKINEYSWNAKANVLWLDQPAGTGFSSGAWDHDEAGVGKDFYAFLENFYEKMPQYKKNPLFITGESYAGHYVPAVSHEIWERNKQNPKFVMPLRGIAIGNGLTNPEEQYRWYPQMAEDGGKAMGGSLEKGVITNEIALGIMKAAVIPCVDAIKSCNAGDSTSCASAFVVCNYGETVPYQVTGMNPYDMRIACESPPLCYNFEGVTKFLNRADVKAAIGAESSWESCNLLLNKMFMGDWMHNFDDMLPPMLKDGIEVLIYAGDVDYICNWLGNKAWSLGMEWDGKASFNGAEDLDYKVGEKVAGRIRSHAKFHFLQIYNAGHMVPMDQPEAALQMLNEFVSGKLSRNGEEDDLDDDLDEDSIYY